MTRRRGSRAVVIAVLASLLSSCAVPPIPRRGALLRTSAAATSWSWPRRQVLDMALQAYACGQREGTFRRPILTVIDYSLPSTEARLWVIDVERKRVLHHELVAHGRNSGDTLAVAFSNAEGSRQSSLGLFRTDDVYIGRHGRSLRLSGLEPGINDNARDRAIVMHGAAYVSAAHIAKWGMLGRSWGCPAVGEDASARIIAQIEGGSAVFAYYPDAAWLRDSRYLHCDGQYAAR